MKKFASRTWSIIKISVEHFLQRYTTDSLIHCIYWFSRGKYFSIYRFNINVYCFNNCVGSLVPRRVVSIFLKFSPRHNLWQSSCKTTLVLEYAWVVYEILEFSTMAVISLYLLRARPEIQKIVQNSTTPARLFLGRNLNIITPCRHQLHPVFTYLCVCILYIIYLPK